VQYWKDFGGFEAVLVTDDKQVLVRRGFQTALNLRAASAAIRRKTPRSAQKSKPFYEGKLFCIGQGFFGIYITEVRSDDNIFFAVPTESPFVGRACFAAYRRAVGRTPGDWTVPAEDVPPAWKSKCRRGKRRNSGRRFCVTLAGKWNGTHRSG
jgi:hypothetical protein